MKPFLILLLGALLLTASSCAYYCTPLAAYRTTSHSAVLYGRFKLADGNTDGFRIGIWVKDISSGKNYYLALVETNAVYGADVKPGNYSIMGFIGSNREHEIQAKHEFNTATNHVGLSRIFEVKPGSLVYIGDFAGAATYDRVLVEWKLKTVANNFILTTTEFHRRYPWSELMTIESAFNKAQ